MHLRLHHAPRPTPRCALLPVITASMQEDRARMARLEAKLAHDPAEYARFVANMAQLRSKVG